MGHYLTSRLTSIPVYTAVNGKIHVGCKGKPSLYDFNALHQVKEWLELALRLLTLKGESMDAHSDSSAPERSFYGLRGTTA